MCVLDNVCMCASFIVFLRVWLCDCVSLYVWLRVFPCVVTFLWCVCMLVDCCLSMYVFERAFMLVCVSSTASMCLYVFRSVFDCM